MEALAKLHMTVARAYKVSTGSYNTSTCFAEIICKCASYVVKSNGLNLLEFITNIIRIVLSVHIYSYKII